MLLEVSNLFVEYPGSHEGHVLSDLSFAVEKGQKIALIGANGAGKSTLLHTLVGLIPIHSGKIQIEGMELQKENLALVRQKLGLIFQNPDDQLFMPTVFEDIVFGPVNYAEQTGFDKKTIEDKALCVMEKLDIAHLKNRMSHKLSGGEKRLAALAGVLTMEPEVLLMDEPSSFLDPRARRNLIEVIKGLPQSCLIATHDLDMAEKLCDSCLLLNKGHLQISGALADVMRNTALLDECGM